MNEPNATANAMPTQAQAPAERLAALNRVTMALARSTSVDELWRNAVTMGIAELGFDRLGIYVIEPDAPNKLLGTYGTSKEGKVTDHHAFIVELPSDHWLLSLAHKKDLAYYGTQQNVELFGASVDFTPERVGMGWNAGAALWNGEAIIGYLLTDNLLHQQQYTEFDGELLALYAGAIGHLCFRLHTEESLRSSHRAEYDFRTRLAKLNDVAVELMRAPDLDTLCRNVIELGRAELDFDRLGLWLLNADRTVLHGTYGTWIDGSLKDERHLQVSPTYFEEKLRGWNRHDIATIGSEVQITTPETDLIGHGWRAIALLHNGEEGIGYLSTDNLLHQRPYQSVDGELLNAYAHIIGPLIVRQRLTEQLRERQAYNQALINAIPDMLFVLTAEGIYRDFYASNEEILYVPASAFLGRHVSTVLSPELADRVLEALQSTLATGQMTSLEYTLVIEDETRSYDARIVPLDTESCLTLVRDLTDRKKLEEQLYVSQKMESLGRMASGIAHDFNNILTVTQGYASLGINQLLPEQDKLRQSLSKIVDATDKGMHLTRQLLSFARKQVVIPEIVDINTKIREMSSMIHQLMDDEVAFIIKPSAQPLFVKIDPSQLEQVILNLSVNARDAMRRGDLFTLSCALVTRQNLPSNLMAQAAADSYVMLEARDTGTGIEEAFLAQIFEPFFTTKPGEKGSGLGLAICYSIVQQNGGYIHVESTLGSGTTFQIFLPHLPSADVPTIGNHSFKQPDGTETILIAEDDEIICQMATEILNRYGYTTLAFINAADALHCAQTHSGPIHLLMTDMMMPRMNGQELAEAILQIYPGLPILMVSGYVGQLPEQFVNRANFYFLPKPYRVSQLIEAIRAALTATAALASSPP